MRLGKYLSIKGLLIAAVVFVVINSAAGPLLQGARLDLTEGNLNTLSPGTINILRGLDDTVNLDLYWSREAGEDLPGLKLYAKRVEDLLEEYSARARGKIRLEVIDPKPFSEEEDDAVRYGLQGVTTGSSGDVLYFGLVARRGDGTRIIPFIQPDREKFLEYDISQMIYSLSHPEKIRVTVMSALPVAGGPMPGNPFSRQPPWMIMDQFHKQFNVTMVGLEDGNIPDDTDVLMVIYPRDLGPEALYALDQFVLRGGHALIFTDPMSEAVSASSPSRALEEENPFIDILRAWGVGMEPGKVVGDIEAAQRVAVSWGRGSRVVSYLPWLAMRDDGINREEVITSRLARVNLASAGALKPLEDSSLTFVPLIQSSKRSMLIDVDKLAFMPDPAKLLSDFSPGGESFTLAARITGTATTAFPEGRPKDKKEDKKDTAEQSVGEHLKTSTKPINVIVVADTDILQDRFWVEVQNFFGRRIAIPTADNADFVVNALDQLGGSEDLISIRSRDTSIRPFKLLAKIQQKAEIKYRAKEQELLNSLSEAEQKINDLQRKRKDSESPILTEEQEKELENFREEKVRIRRDLRSVQFQLREDIDRLKALLKFANILLMPIIIALLSVAVLLMKRKRDRRGFVRSNVQRPTSNVNY